MTTPLETNARRIVGVMVQHFFAGATCADLRRQFEKDTSLARQSFYNALNFSKKLQWIIGGGSDRRDPYQLYRLNPNGCWKEPLESIGAGLEKHRLEYLVDKQMQQIEGLQGELERLRDWSCGDDGNGANIALSSLIRIVGDASASPRQRIRAAAAVLGYKAPDDTAEFVKRYLTSVCENIDVSVDHRIEAGELLRRHEAPRVMSEIVRPNYPDDDNAEPPEPLKDLVARRRERADRMEREMVEQMERERLRLDEAALEQPLDE